MSDDTAIRGLEPTAIEQLSQLAAAATDWLMMVDVAQRDGRTYEAVVRLVQDCTYKAAAVARCAAHGTTQSRMQTVWETTLFLLAASASWRAFDVLAARRDRLATARPRTTDDFDPAGLEARILGGLAAGDALLRNCNVRFQLPGNTSTEKPQTP